MGAWCLVVRDRTRGRRVTSHLGSERGVADRHMHSIQAEGDGEGEQRCAYLENWIRLLMSHTQVRPGADTNPSGNHEAEKKQAESCECQTTKSDGDGLRSTSRKVGKAGGAARVEGVVRACQTQSESSGTSCQPMTSGQTINQDGDGKRPEQTATTKSIMDKKGRQEKKRTVVCVYGRWEQRRRTRTRAEGRHRKDGVNSECSTLR